MSYDNTNSGALFKNKRKEKDTHPDYNGSVEVKCPECGAVSPFWLSGWLKVASAKAKNAGEKFFSLALNPKEEKKAKDPELGEDDIPF